MESPKTRLKMRRIQRHNHQKTRDQACAGQRNDPTRKDEANLLPIDSFEIEIAQGDANGSAGETLGGGNREGEARGEQDGDGGAEFHGEATGRRDLGDFVAEGAHNVVAVEPEAEAEEEAGDDEDPDGGIGFLCDDAGRVGVVGAYPGADCVGDC